MNLSICLDILRTQIPVDEITVVGGGAKGKVWRQMMADVYNAKVSSLSVLEEGNSMGAAVLGGVGVGLFKSFRAINRFIEVKETCLPDPRNVEAYLPVKETWEIYYEALKDAFHRTARQRGGGPIEKETISSHIRITSCVPSMWLPDPSKSNTGGLLCHVREYFDPPR